MSAPTPNLDDVRAALERGGLRVAETVVHREVFGSWVVTLEARPRVRVFWDGKDGWLIVQRELPGGIGASSTWEDVWIERDPGDRTVEAAVAVVRGAVVEDVLPS